MFGSLKMCHFWEKIVSMQYPLYTRLVNTAKSIENVQNFPKTEMKCKNKMKQFIILYPLIAWVKWFIFSNQYLRLACNKAQVTMYNFNSMKIRAMVA